MPRGFKKDGTKLIPPSNKGKIMSEETRKKMSLSRIGHKMSDISKSKISVSNTGKKNGKKGKKISQETKNKISFSNGIKKGWITPKRLLIRTSTNYLLWRKACMERDNFTCQKTGQYGGKLEVHHINNFSEFPELRTSIENGITLSKESHKKFHKLYGRYNNTKEQLNSFLQKDNLVVNF
jgi:5-methylcytosine-specific restriction endonuclease McrA